MSYQETRKTLIDKLVDQYNDDSWEEFVHYYRGYIYSVIKSSGFAHEDCEDLTQTVLLKAWKSIPKFQYEKQRCRFRSWLTIVTRNTIRDYLKSRDNKLSKLRVSDEENTESLEVYYRQSESSDIEKLADLEWKEYISKLAWENIQSDFDEKILKVFLEGASERKTADIAAEFDIKENTVYAYKGRVQKALMKEIIRLDAHLG